MYNLWDPENTDDPEDPTADTGGPFDSQPPSVHDTQAANGIDPFAEDPNDPRIQRRNELDKFLRNRSGSLGGIIASFSPSGDKQLTAAMTERQHLGSEIHGDYAMRSAMARALSNAEARERAAQIAATARMYGADQSVNAANVRGGWGYDTQGLRNTGATNVQTSRNAGNLAVQNSRNAGGLAVQNARNAGSLAVQQAKPAAAGRGAPQDPVVKAQVAVLTDKLKKIQSALIADVQGTKPLGDAKVQVLHDLNETRRQLQALTGQAPSVQTVPTQTQNTGATNNDPLGIR